jgi:hemerythrin superfamily protein
MDVIEVLQIEHRQVESLLDRLLGTAVPQRRARLLRRVSAKLRANVGVEETIFYPAFRDACREWADRQLFLEALESHCLTAELRLEALESLRPDDPRFARAVYALAHAVEQHHRREQALVFARAREVLSESQRGDLGQIARGFCRKGFRPGRMEARPVGA